MKKFFKALALVLALALVVGVLPTAEAQAAKTHKVKNKTLFIGGSTGTKTNGKTCGTKETVTLRYLAGYTNAEAKGHTFDAEVTDGKNYITVKNGKVKALAAGIGKTATLTVIVDGKKVDKSTTIKICKNATKDSLTIVCWIPNPDSDDAKTNAYIPNPENGADGLPAEFLAGVNYLFKLPQGGKDTDQRRLFINNTEVLENYYKDSLVVPNKRNYLYTFDVEKAGSVANIEIQAYQSDKFAGNSTTPRKFSVPVNVKLITSAQQIAYNKFAVTFDTAEHAKQAADTSNKYLNNADKAVTSQEYVIELFADPDNNTAKRNVYMAGFAVDDKNPKIVNCTVFGDLEQKAVYEVAYGDDVTERFTTVEWIPTAIRAYYTYAPTNTQKLEEGGVATLTKTVVTVNETKGDVDITDKVAEYISWSFDDSVSAGNPNATDYSVDASEGDVTFDKPNKVVDVAITLNFNNGTKEFPLKAIARAESKVVLDYALKYYWSVPHDTQGETKTNTKAEIYANTDQRIYITLYGTKAGWNENCTDEMMTLRSSDDERLSVYPVVDGSKVYWRMNAGDKNDKDAIVNVYVYYNSERVGFIPVQIYKTARLNKVEVVAKTDKLLSQVTTVGAVTYIGAEGKGAYVPVDDKEKFYFMGVDQHGYYYPDVTATIQKSYNDNLTAAMININDNPGLSTPEQGAVALLYAAGNAVANTNYHYVTFSAGATEFPVKGQKYSASYKIFLTDNNDRSNTKYGTVSFSAKNVDANTTVSTAKVVPVADVLTDPTTYVAENQYCVMGYDSQGFRVCGFYLSENIGDKNYSQTTAIDKADRMYLKFTDSYGNFRHATVATGAAGTVSKAAPTGLTVATFTPIEKVYRAGLPTLNTTTNGGYMTGDVTTFYTNANNGGAVYYDKGTFKYSLYKNGSQLGITKTETFAKADYWKLTWKWANSGAYSKSNNARNALDECIVFTYEYKDYNDGNKWKTVKVNNKSELTWSQLVAEVPGVFDLAYLDNGVDARFMYVYVNQYAAATKCGLAQAVIDVSAGNDDHTADLRASKAARDQEFIYTGAKSPADGLWVAIKIDRGTKLTP